MDLARLKGCITALVTPFTAQGEVDFDALSALVRYQIDNDIHGLVPCGSTGEAATMTETERFEAIRLVVEQSGGRVPVIAGTGTNGTKSTIANSLQALEAGADAVLVVAPYYNKPTQEGMYLHFSTIAKAIAPAPVVLYNVPGRTASNLTPETVLRLTEIENIVALKEASGGLNNTMEILAVRPDFRVFSGEDGLYFPMLAVGAAGLISVTSNVDPKRMAEIFDAFESGNTAAAKDLFYKLWPLFGAMFYETNPIPVKAALGLMGKIHPTPRLPLTDMTPGALTRLDAVLKEVGLVQ